MKSLPAGSRIGVLGGGQLGRFLALEARRLGYRTAVLDPSAGGPAAQVADEHIQAAVDDEKAALELARRSDVVTLEWELFPASILRRIEAVKPLHPSSAVLGIIQDRLVQKEFLAKKGFPQARFMTVTNADELSSACGTLNFPCILKRRRQGYDGKGQLLLEDAGGLSAAIDLLKAPCVLEAKIPFAREISVILARGQDGKTAVYPPAENAHRNGILRTTRVPAQISDAVKRKAENLALAAADALDHVGVMAVEMFVLDGGDLMINEIAPRVHNSGHFTLGACAASQFEQHLRAVCGLPLAEPGLLRPAIMVNLLGELWAAGEPRWDILRGRPEIRLHLYGKARPETGRKMGHLLMLGGDAERSLALAEDLLDEISPKHAPTRA